MDTAMITIKVDPKTKNEFKDVSEQLGMPVSSLIRGFIRHVIKTKRVEYSLDEKPTQYLLDALRESEEDIKEGRVISFKNSEEATSHVQRLIDEDEQNEKNRLHQQI